MTQASLDYSRIEKALQFLNANHRRHPALDEIAGHVHLSPFHFERLFQRWAGTSPKRFLQFITKEHAKVLLRESRSLMDTAFESGLSGVGRLHDLFVSCEAVTPGEYKRNGQGVTLRYGVHPTPFGDCLVATTERGICALRFDEGLPALRAEWSAALFIRDQAQTGQLCRQVFGTARGKFQLHLRGTNFQLNVWQALLSIPAGTLVSYRDIAEKIGAPGNSRAVGSAIGRNSIAYLIPCHRVIQSMGVITGYRWGSVRKQALIGWEASRYTAAAMRSPT
ncbi:MAG: Bifunctional transcriptional activator/DNA repair enzyme Ada [Verrucomicrobiae bacterium]|nr:Bifunctional transcriptional activator/DNA repair enzyme Ada [Verrucomicrobiae bacterium]